MLILWSHAEFLISPGAVKVGRKDKRFVSQGKMPNAAAVRSRFTVAPYEAGMGISQPALPKREQDQH